MTNAVDGVTAVLGDLVAALVVGASERVIVDRAVESMVDMLPVSGAGVTLIAPGRRPGIVAASSSVAFELERLQADLQEGPCVVASDAQQACLSPDLAGDARFARYGPAAVKAGAAGAFAFPLRFRGASLGAIDLYRARTGSLSDSQIAAAQVISDAIAAFLANARWHGQLEAFTAHLQEIVGRDPLTGLPDRVLLLDRLEQALRRRERSGRMVGVIFIDVDGFKMVNDRYGHQTGDQVLITLAEQLAGVLRPADTLARWGGDEFVIVCEGLAARDELDHLLGRVEKQVNAAVKHDGDAVTVSASYGAALSTREDDTPDGLINAADRAMYAHKRGRRDPSSRRRGRPATPTPFEAPFPEHLSANVAADSWRERWIPGPTPNAGAFALVAYNASLGELTITELDDRVLVIARHQWLPGHDDRASADGHVELTITDWDEREIQRSRVWSVPAPPTDRDELHGLLTEIDAPR